MDDLISTDFVFRLRAIFQHSEDATQMINNILLKVLYRRISGSNLLDKGGRGEHSVSLFLEDDTNGASDSLPTASLCFRYLVVIYNKDSTISSYSLNHHDLIHKGGLPCTFSSLSTPGLAPLQLQLSNLWGLSSSFSLQGNSNIIPQPIYGGHRGEGKRGTVLLQENTISSFSSVLKSTPHVPFVELDVQWTSDNIPIIFHDFYFRNHQGRQVTVRQCTLQEWYEFDPNIPSVKQILVELPSHFGLNMELKYPHQDAHLLYPDRNLFIDAVLEVVALHNHNHIRPVIFSSFDSDICMKTVHLPCLCSML